MNPPGIRTSTYRLGNRLVNRMGYGAMQLAGPGVFEPPKDRKVALAVLSEAVGSGVDHIDTSDFYGPHVTNQLIREALHPYPKELVIVTKMGARRDSNASWIPAFAPEELTRAVHDNLRNLGLDVLEVVNLRIMFGIHAPAEGSIEAPMAVLAELQRQGLIRHIDLSNVTAAQVAEGRRICKIACVQNLYNFVQRADDPLIDSLARDGIAYVPFFPLGGFTPVQSGILNAIAQQLAATPRRSRSPGSFSALPTYSSFLEPRLLHICARTWRRRPWISRATRTRPSKGSWVGAFSNDR
jgi:pyridoxine 4-dehydrogenase